MLDFRRDILGPVESEFRALDDFIQHGVHSNVALVMTVSNHVVRAGGKRLRPLMTLLAAQACQALESQRDTMIRLAAVVEMLHTATLVHDDVVDESGLRRGVPTANITWGNATAVLVGDFLIARSFDVLVSLETWPLIRVFSTGTCEIAEGEVLQLQHQHNPDSTEADYLQIVYGKTARLFMLALQGAAILSNQPQLEGPLAEYGRRFGNAFQIIDDILDYTSDSQTMGKNIGDDLMEGKPTLPLIAAQARVGEVDRALLCRCIQTGGLDELSRVIELVQSSGALDYCRQRAREETDAALAALDELPESRGKQGLVNLAQFAFGRLA